MYFKALWSLYYNNRSKSNPNPLEKQYINIKTRKIQFKETFRGACVLVSTDVAAMGLDTDDLNFSLNIGNVYQI